MPQMSKEAKEGYQPSMTGVINQND
jgi:hypothetical protein